MTGRDPHKTVLPHALEIRDVLSVAKRAGAIVMEQLNRGVAVDHKGDGSPVTIADKLSDAALKEGLRKLTLTIPVLSEESADEEKRATNGSPWKWVIDPVDGTQTAIDYANGHKDYDQFGVHIALMHQDVPVLGVCCLPAQHGGKGTVYYTGKDGKAYMQIGDDAPKPIKASKLPFANGVMRASVHFHTDRQPADICGRAYAPVPGVGGQRLCLVAEGSADIADMTRGRHYGYKMWDLAAGHAVLKAAGGELIDVSTGAPVDYRKVQENGFQMPDTYAAGMDVLKLLEIASAKTRPNCARSGIS